jgi:hypothetical protein
VFGKLPAVLALNPIKQSSQIALRALSKELGLSKYLLSARSRRRIDLEA